MIDRGRRKPIAGAAEPAELRCVCSNLLARYVSGGVELKCRRCKRKVVVALDTAAAPSNRV